MTSGSLFSNFRVASAGTPTVARASLFVPLISLGVWESVGEMVGHKSKEYSVFDRGKATEASVLASLRFFSQNPPAP